MTLGLPNTWITTGAPVYLTAKGRRFHPIAVETVAEVGALVAAQLGERRTEALSRTLGLLGDLESPTDHLMRPRVSGFTT